MCYHFGRGVKKDRRKAVKWYTKAAEQGADIAQYNLAFLYENGIGVEKDSTKAVSWYTEAVKQGNKKAQEKIDSIYDRQIERWVDIEGKALGFYSDNDSTPF